MPDFDTPSGPPEVENVGEKTQPQQSQPLASSLEIKKKSPSKRRTLVIGLHGVGIILGLYFFYSIPLTNIVNNIFPPSSDSDDSISGSLFSGLLEVASKKQPNYKLAKNFMIYVPDSCSARFRSNSP